MAAYVACFRALRRGVEFGVGRQAEIGVATRLPVDESENDLSELTGTASADVHSLSEDMHAPS